MAAHSSVLAWRIPQTEGPGGLRSMGSQRVGLKRLNTHTHTHTHIEPCFQSCLVMDPITSSLSFTLPLLNCINSLESNIMKNKFIIIAGTCMELYGLQSTLTGTTITVCTAACKS